MISMLIAACLAEYQQGKIDMHGDKESYITQKKKGSFSTQSMGMSMFMDNNKSKDIKKKNYKNQ